MLRLRFENLASPGGIATKALSHSSFWSCPSAQVKGLVDYVLILASFSTSRLRRATSLWTPKGESPASS